MKSFMIWGNELPVSIQSNLSCYHLNHGFEPAGSAFKLVAADLDSFLCVTLDLKVQLSLYCNCSVEKCLRCGCRQWNLSENQISGYNDSSV